jgi:L-aspartate oxidase
LYHEEIASLNVESLVTDYLVVGAGVAGLRAAIELASSGEVLILAKDSLQESSSEYAQGGIAAALSDDDEVSLHEEDTIAAGDGLCNREAVRVLVQEGPAAIEELIAWGAEFDREGSKLLFAREGAHSRRRVLHAHGDSTGREISRTLGRKAASLQGVQFRSFSVITDLLMEDGEVCGAVALDEIAGRVSAIYARAVLLATGGLGRVFSETTNPDVATGDGVAMAFRAGAAVSDIEFIQFHPTALRLPGAPAFLLSEALRGEGAILRNEHGYRFMPDYHPMAELAPRDVVARAILSEVRETNTHHVLLDLTHLPAGFVPRRFPRIYETCLRHGVDLCRQPAPVLPAAHYAMGGVRTDLHGRTSLAGLYAAGEVACTGVHGANRLASNSLLEGMVFGARAGRAMSERRSVRRRTAVCLPAPDYPEIDDYHLRRLATETCGLTRDAAGLRSAIENLCAVRRRAMEKPVRRLLELRSLHTVLLLIARCALAREESRGGHYRSDFPEKRPEFQKHSFIQKDLDEIVFQ